MKIKRTHLIIAGLSFLTSIFHNTVMRSLSLLEFSGTLLFGAGLVFILLVAGRDEKKKDTDKDQEKK